MKKESIEFVSRISGKRMNALVTGSGKPVLCLSGFGCDHYNYLEMVDVLAKYYQLILLDNRGMGKSEYATSFYTLRDLAIDSLDFMDQFGANHFSLLGISMGSFIAQLICDESPERISALGLLCGSGLGEKFIPIPILDEDYLRDFYQSDLAETMPKAVALTTYPDFKDENPEQFQKIVSTRLKHPASIEQIIWQVKAVKNFFESEKIDYKKIVSPTLILSGADDRFVNPENSKVLGSKIKSSLVDFIEKSDHFFFMEKPEAVATKITNFLNEVY